MEMEESTVNANEVAEEKNVQEVKEEKEVKASFTRDDVNKMIAAEKRKLEQELKQQLEKEKTEAERLAKMTAEEKAQEKERQLAEKEAELNYKELVGNAKDILSDRGLSASFAEWIVSKSDTAEKVTEKIEDFAKKYNQDLDRLVQKRLAGSVPKTAIQGTKKQIARSSY